MKGHNLGLFITFEGGEGCGKSYQSKILFNRLKKLRIPAILTYEPGGTVLGDEVRRILKTKHESTISSAAELFLFFACRIQLVNEVIQPALKKNMMVLCDRFADSTIAYQGYGRGLDLTIIKKIQSLATQGLVPDLTFLLDVPVDIGLNRKKNKGIDRFEAEAAIFHNRVRQGYLKLSTLAPERWSVIDGTLPRTKISQIIWEKITPLIKNIKK